MSQAIGTRSWLVTHQSVVSKFRRAEHAHATSSESSDSEAVTRGKSTPVMRRP